MRRACTRALYHYTLCRVLPKIPQRTCPVRPFCSGKKDDGKPTVVTPLDLDDDLEDEMSFNVAVEEEEVPVVSIDTPIDEKELTPEMASELVERMVAAASATAKSAESAAYGIGGVITPHTISVLRAARFTTNEVLSPGTSQVEYPVNRKVVANLDVDQLGLSAAAHEALRSIAGSRYKDKRVSIGCVRFRSSEENLTSAVATLEHLVRAAKEAVGEEVNDTVLVEWSDVEREVKLQCGEEVPVEALLKGRERRDETFIASVPSTVSQ